MTYKTSLKLSLYAGAMVVLMACAATPKSTEAVVYEKPKNQKEAAILASSQLSATNNVTKSADGTIICKRQTIVGSNFKRKICMTQDQLDQSAAETRQVLDEIQRSKDPGVGQ